MKLFAGNSNRVLAEAVARYLNISLGKAVARRGHPEVLGEIRPAESHIVLAAAIQMRRIVDLAALVVILVLLRRV